jgi:hypothetical protein
METFSAHGQRQTTTPNYVISSMWEVKPRITPQKTSKLFKEPEQVTRPKKPCKLFDDDDEETVCFLMDDD